MIGTRGVPARYGGFETAVEEIGRRLVIRGHEVTVFCRGAESQLSKYLGMQLVHLPSVNKKALETLSHTALSVVRSEARGADVAFVFNAANAPFLPLLRASNVPVALHVDGLEWQRSKWSGSGRRYYQLCEKLGVQWADELIADARGIQDYYRDTHQTGSRFVPYGAHILNSPRLERLAELGVAPGEYHLVVARFEPENHVELIIDGYIKSGSRKPLLVVGSAPYAEGYVNRLTALADSDDRVRMLGGMWDQELLDALYAGASSYLHGHSVGGTNPSLLRAMGAAAPVSAYDVVFNREVLAEHGEYWSTPDDVAALVDRVDRSPAMAVVRGEHGRSRAKRAYCWDVVTDGYERIAEDLAGGWSRRKDRHHLVRERSQADRCVNVNVVLDQFGTEPEATEVLYSEG